MENLIYWSLPIMLLCAILYGLKKRLEPEQKNRHPLGYDVQQAEMDIPTQEIPLPQLITIYFVPQNGESFLGYELLQSFSSLGFTYGDHQLFHFNDENGSPLFSISQAAEPGTFNLEELGDFACDKGIALFMDIDVALENQALIEQFWDLSVTLAEDLGATMCQDNMEPLTHDFITQWQAKLSAISKKTDEVLA